MVTHNYAKWVDELDQQYYYSDNMVGYSDDMNQLSQNFGEWVFSTDYVVPTDDVNFVPDESTQNLEANATDNATAEESSASTIVSWADEMSSHDLEEAKGSDDSEVKSKSEDENARRKEESNK